MNGVVGLAVICLVAWCLCSGGKTASGRAHHVHGANRRAAARHEGGHAAVGRHVGAKVGRGWINDNGAGAIHVGYARTSAQDIAISLGGGMAEGAGIGSRQCRGDKAYIDSVLRKVPRSQRQIVMDDARFIARKALSAQAGTARRVERQLLQRGRV